MTRVWAPRPRRFKPGPTRGDVPGLAPEPLHVGHGADVGTASGTCAPLTAWSKLSETSVSRSRPRWARGRGPRAEPRPPVPAPPAPPAPPPPNRLERMSEKLPATFSKPPAPG